MSDFDNDVIHDPDFQREWKLWFEMNKDRLDQDTIDAEFFTMQHAYRARSAELNAKGVELAQAWPNRNRWDSIDAALVAAYPGYDIEAEKAAALQNVSREREYDREGNFVGYREVANPLVLSGPAYSTLPNSQDKHVFMQRPDNPAEPGGFLDYIGSVPTKYATPATHTEYREVTPDDAYDRAVDWDNRDMRWTGRREPMSESEIKELQRFELAGGGADMSMPTYTAKFPPPGPPVEGQGWPYAAPNPKTTPPRVASAGELAWKAAIKKDQ